MRRKGRRHSQETKQKIAQSNTGKIFSLERRQNISRANKTSVTKETLQKLQELWKLRYLNPRVIMALVGLGPSVYKRIHAVHCNIEQLGFMPKDWYPDDYLKLIELANQHVWYVEIAKQMNRGRKQIVLLSKKMNLPINTKDPNAYSCTSSKLEFIVQQWLIDAGVDYETQFSLGRFFFDIHVLNTNLLIEIHGDYWHCNPHIYINGPINDMQRKAIRRDFTKREQAKRAGYSRYLIWENSIMIDADRERSKLLEKIQKKTHDNE